MPYLIQKNHRTFSEKQYHRIWCHISFHTKPPFLCMQSLVSRPFKSLRWCYMQFSEFGDWNSKSQIFDHKQLAEPFCPGDPVTFHISGRISAAPRFASDALRNRALAKSEIWPRVKERLRALIVVDSCGAMILVWKTRWFQIALWNFGWKKWNFAGVFVSNGSGISDVSPFGVLARKHQMMP